MVHRPMHSLRSLLRRPAGRQVALSGLVILGLAAVFGADATTQPSPAATASPLATPATQPAAWSTDLNAAMRTAAAQNRDTIVWFSGSGWNAASDAVEPSLRAAAFTETAGRSFVLARADFAAGRENEKEIDPQYTVWAERLGVVKLPAL
ncbi:MAG TPA: hypothetical protein VF595_15350, partial [Tepidisphaeraceae bacterium]